MTNQNAGGGRLDLPAIAASADLVEIAGRYLELRRAGTEHEALCPFHADGNPSFTVYRGRDGTHRFMCFACGERGDAIDFVAKIENVDKVEAARRISGNDRAVTPITRPEPAPPAWRALLPVPDDAPAMDPAAIYNPKRDRTSKIRPTRQDEYRDAGGRLLGYVLRADIEGRKWTPTVTYAEGPEGRRAWALVPFPTPRPLQGLDDLAARPQAPVLVVEGEKAREAAAGALRGFVVVTWPGGTNGVRNADWTPLHGRTVTLWPDADQPGRLAADDIGARLGGATVRILDVSDLEAKFGEGADVADLVAAGWETPRIIAWARSRVREWSPGEKKPACEPVEEKAAGASAGDDRGNRATAGETEQPTPPAEDDHTPTGAASATLPAQHVEGELVDLPPQSATYNTILAWEQLGLEKSDKGKPHANLDNATALLERHPEAVGRFWYDEFLQRILSTWNAQGVPREWSDADDVRLALWMQRRMKIDRMAVGTARDAVTAVAMAHTRNECREWLDSLRWDGRRRLEDMVPIAFGAEANTYTAAVGRCWMISMVARVFDPGCKVDTMPVLEGLQGRGKSTALQVLVGSQWFAEAAESPTSKDFYQVLTGKMLVEIAELDAFSRAEVNTIKRVITCQVDRYRAPYARRAEDHPRMCVFAGTTNKDDWNRDETGARRFWPIACSEVDIEWIRRWREQLFAEAVHRFKAGESWWDVPREDAEREQEARRDSDEWEAVVSEWLMGRRETTVGEVLLGAIKVPTDRWDRSLQMRAAKCLRVLGWHKTDARRGARVVKVWTPIENANGPLL